VVCRWRIFLQCAVPAFFCPRFSYDAGRFQAQCPNKGQGGVVLDSFIEPASGFSMKQGVFQEA
jgi:hypothetical protein